MHNKLFGSFVVLLLVTPVQAAECQLARYAELPVTMAGTMPLITGTINGADALFLADSGAFFSVLSRESAEKFELKLGPLPDRLRIRGTGGAAAAKVATIKDFTLKGLGNRVIHNVDFVVTGNSFATANVAGIIGQNILGNEDTEYDFANGAIRLYRTKDCGDRSLAYWSGSADVAVIDIESRSALQSHLIGRGTLNGVKIRVVFDTGAWRSVLTLKAAARAGITPEHEEVSAVGISRGVGKKMTETSIARFESLNLGGEQIKNARLLIGDISISNGDMLLGSDFFLSHRVYVASKQNKIYFTYNGGPVFDLGLTPRSRSSTEANSSAEVNDDAVAGAVAPAEVAVVDVRDVPTDAAGFRRRGAAYAGRRDFDSAIADFDRAIALDAADPENYFQRGSARMQMRNGRQALSDFDQVLKLKPDHIPALLERGTVHLAMNNTAGARADFKAIDNLAPDDPSIGLQIAQTYVATQYFDEAIERFSRWIVANPKDDRLAVALNGRCRSRVMMDRDLDDALADCNAALKSSSRNSQIFDSRALVWLRRGDFDKAISDFNASLKLQPKSALSLYGLGVAELKKGSAADSDKHIQAALEITPTIDQLYKRLKLIP